MLLNLEDFKNQKKEECTMYYWRVEVDLIEKLDKLAKENGVRKGILVRYIINWSCEKIEKDEEYREHMLTISMIRNVDVKKVLRSYTISANVQEKFSKVREKYRLYNISYFANESIRKFFEEIE